MKSAILLCIIFANLVTKSSQVMFHLQPNSQKCLREELNKDVIVAGEFEVQEVLGQTVDLQVTDTKQHILFSRVDAKTGKFVFNTENDDLYEVCFISKVPPTGKGMQQEVTIKVKHGVEAKSYEAFALGEAAKLKPLEIELKKLEDLSSNIVGDFSEMRKREEQMRDTNESTNSRVFYFSLFSIACLIALATIQVLYLRKFFRSKKLIE